MDMKAWFVGLRYGSIGTLLSILVVVLGVAAHLGSALAGDILTVVALVIIWGLLYAGRDAIAATEERLDRYWGRHPEQ